MINKRALSGTHPEKVSLLKRLEDLQLEQKHLTAHLRASFSIEAIWQEAFDHGTVSFSGIQRHLSSNGLGRAGGLAFTEAWFSNSKYTRWLTADELKQFKPEALIHPDYDGRDGRVA